MRTLRHPAVLLVLTAILIPAGCSSTAGVRSGSAPKIRTIASVGDKTLPAEVGESGSAVAADEYTPERRVDNDGRVSGRVFDESGDAVANARVRLALGGSAGGKLVTTTTDPSGAFTLRGLRPGASYTIIAETKDAEQGALRGHSEAQAPDADVRITLMPDDTSVPPARASRDVGKKVSRPRRAAPDAEDDDQDAKILTAPGRNELLPPAPEAESFVPARDRATAKANAASDPEPPMTARWRRGDADQPATRTRPASSAHAPSESADDGAYDDDGQNPLPPALESGGGGSSSRTSARSTPARAKVARADADQAPGTREIVPENFTPIALADQRARGGPPPGLAASEPGPSRSSSAAKAPPAVPWYQTPEPNREPEAEPETPRVAHEESAFVTQNEPEESEAPAPRRRRTWRDLAAAPPDGRELAAAPPADSPGPRALESPAESPGPRSLAPQEAEGNAVLATAETTPRRAAPAVERQPQDHAVAYCRFDAKTRRLVDFCLPDITGKPVRLQDLDSDLVLLDFWGTWCKPCVNSIPHLVELQNKLGGKRLTIVGIASEQGTPAARAAKVSEAVQRLGINYPILLSGMDGENCPVQEALHIQAFPTLILLDREGRVIVRDQGATPATLAKLDQLIAAKSDASGDTRRY